jgi:hypothetical protein
MDIKYAQIRSQLLRIAHCNLVCGALYTEIRRFACVFVRILKACIAMYGYRIRRFIKFVKFVTICGVFRISVWFIYAWKASTMPFCMSWRHVVVAQSIGKHRVSVHYPTVRTRACPGAALCSIKTAFLGKRTRDTLPPNSSSCRENDPGNHPKITFWTVYA